MTDFDTKMRQDGQTAADYIDEVTAPPRPEHIEEVRPLLCYVNPYELKQEARRERLEARAERLRAKAGRHFTNARGSLAGIEPGQPILVGHHSEGKHRAALRRHDANMRAGIEAEKAANAAASRADSVGSGGISSDDPEAIDKLRAALKKREDEQENMRKANKAIRSKDPVGALVALGYSVTQAEGLLTPDFCGRKGFPDYALSNNNAQIRRLKDRIAALEKNATRETTKTERNGVRIVENAEDNRLQLFFPNKPSDDVRRILKSRGFRWSPMAGAWQRHLGDNAQAIAGWTLDEIEKAGA